MYDYLPYLDDLERQFLSPTVRTAFLYWRSLLNGRHFPQRRELDPLAIPKQLLRTTMIDVRYDPLDFTIRLIGDYVRTHQGGAPGMRVYDTVSEPQARTRIMARLKMCVELLRPIRGLYHYKPLHRPNSTLWVEVASCPLSDDGETIHQIVTFGADHDFKAAPDAKQWP